MKLLRFGFEGEVVPSEVTITQGQCIVPNSVIDAGYPGQVIKSAGGTKRKWAGYNPGDEGSYSFRQDYTDLSKYPGAYVFETGREGIPGSKAIRGWWWNDGNGVTHYDASGRIGQNMNLTTLRGLFSHTESAQEDNAFAKGKDRAGPIQNLNIKIPASNGVAATYFFKAAKVYGVDATGYNCPQLIDAEGIEIDGMNAANAVSRQSFNSVDDSSNTYHTRNTAEHFKSDGIMFMPKHDSSEGNRISNGALGMAIPNPGYYLQPNSTFSAGQDDWVVSPNNAPLLSLSNHNLFNHGARAYLAGFYLYASSDAILTTYGQPAPDNRKVMVDSIAVFIDGEISSFSLADPINAMEWMNVAFKYTINPNHMFSVQINGQKFEVFGTPGKKLAGLPAVRYLTFPLHFSWNESNQYPHPNAIAYDDIAINNNIVDDGAGNLSFTDSDNFIPGFIRCTGLPLTSEVAGNNWGYEGSNALDTITGQDDVRLYADSTSVNRYRFDNIPASLSGLESINIGVKNANISFPSKIKYIGFGLETGSSRLLGDFSASRIGELSNTEGDHSASLIVDENYPSAFKNLTTADLNNSSIYIEAKKQMGLNFFGLGNFNGRMDNNIKIAFMSDSQVVKNYGWIEHSQHSNYLSDMSQLGANTNSTQMGSNAAWSATMQTPLSTWSEISAMSNAGSMGSKEVNDGDLVLHSPLDETNGVLQSYRDEYPSYGYTQHTIIPTHFKDRAVEVHTKNFVVGKNATLNISLGNWKYDQLPDDFGDGHTRSSESNSVKSYTDSRVHFVDSRPNPQYGEFLDRLSYNDARGAYNTYNRRLGLMDNATLDGANLGHYMDAKNYTNQTPSAVIIYAKENIYIDGDVYFDYGDGIHHAPTEHTYHSKNNTFKIIKFSGQKEFNQDPDTLVRSNNAAFSESIYQHHTANVLDVGDSNIPTDGTVTAIDFTLEAGERQGIVQHGSGGACGDVFGTDSYGRSVHGTNAIGWGCGGGGGLVTGWTDEQGNTLFPMLGLKNTFKRDMPLGLWPLFKMQYGLRCGQYYDNANTIKTLYGGNHVDLRDWNASWSARYYGATGDSKYQFNQAGGSPAFLNKGGKMFDSTLANPFYQNTNYHFDFLQWYDAADPNSIVNQRDGWWFKPYEHPVIREAIHGHSGPVPTVCCSNVGRIDTYQNHDDWGAQQWYANVSNSRGMNYGYQHHIATALFKDLFVNQNPNEGWRYDSPARTGYAGGPWGGGRGASWSHKKFSDEVLGAQNCQPMFYSMNVAYPELNSDNNTLSSTAKSWTNDGGHINAQSCEYHSNSQYHPENHAGGYRMCDIYTSPLNIANFGDPVDTNYGFINTQGTQVGGGVKDSYFRARAYNWQKKDGSKCGSYEWLTNSDYVANISNNDIPQIGLERLDTNTDFWGGCIGGSLAASSQTWGTIAKPEGSVNPKSTSPSLNSNDVVQAWGGSSSLATCGRGGQGGVIVYLIAGGDIVIGPNGKIHARGGHAGGWLDGKYDAPQEITHRHSRFLWCESQARAGYGKMADRGGRKTQGPSTEGTNGAGYGSQALGYVGNDKVTINMAGHGGGGGGCITFLHGGLFKNFGTIDVQGAGSEDHAMAASAFWGWTGDGTNPVWGSENTSGTFQFWSKHNWNYRNFDILPIARTGEAGWSDYRLMGTGLGNYNGASNPLAEAGLFPHYPHNNIFGYLNSPEYEPYYGENNSYWMGNDVNYYQTDIIKKGFTGFCPNKNDLGNAQGLTSPDWGRARNKHHYFGGPQHGAYPMPNQGVYYSDPKDDPAYVQGEGIDTLWQITKQAWTITGAEGYRAEGVPNLCQLQIDETSLNNNPNVVMYPRGGAGAWRNFKIIGNYDNKRSI